MIRAMIPSDWPAVKAIYEEGIATGCATFETKAPSREDWDAAHFPYCRFVYQDKKGNILGWVALSPVSDRCVYGGVAEETIYVARAVQGKGVGSALFEHLIPESENEGMWTLQAGIFRENEISIKIHEKHGFRMIGVREKLGQLGSVWKDVVLMERRSDKF